MRLWLPCKPNPGTLGSRLRSKLLDVLDADEIAEPYTGPRVIRLRFIFQRPGSLAVATPTREPSIAALTRAVLDELPGFAYVEERQLVALHVGKEYGNREGLWLSW